MQQFNQKLPHAFPHLTQQCAQKQRMYIYLYLRRCIYIWITNRWNVNIFCSTSFYYLVPSASWLQCNRTEHATVLWSGVKPGPDLQRLACRRALIYSFREAQLCSTRVCLIAFFLPPRLLPYNRLIHAGSSEEMPITAEFSSQAEGQKCRRGLGSVWPRPDVACGVRRLFARPSFT